MKILKGNIAILISFGYSHGYGCCYGYSNGNGYGCCYGKKTDNGMEEI